LDWNIVKLLPEDLQVEKVGAAKITKPRLVGDIGLRAFKQLTKRSIELIKKEKIDFLYIPIPSFYAALIGRTVHRKTKVPYGIDYIDPWVHTFLGSDKIFSRHWWATKISSFLEPVAVKSASLITGVSEAYYDGVSKRNPHLPKQATFAAMPYGGEEADHEKVEQLRLKPYLFEKKRGIIQLVYAGAMLPKAYAPLEKILEVIKMNSPVFSTVEFHFIGTGKTPTDPHGYNIKRLADKCGLWNLNVFEYPKRIPYLDVLIHLEAADGAFILGSTEPHYTPSKVYQSVLAKKPILAVLHKDSTACNVIRQSDAGVVLEFDGEVGLPKISLQFLSSFHEYIAFMENYDYGNVNQKAFQEHSARSVTAVLASALDRIGK
jgi:hypothetical protein